MRKLLMYITATIFRKKKKITDNFVMDQKPKSQGPMPMAAAKCSFQRPLSDMAQEVSHGTGALGWVPSPSVTL